MNYFHFTIGPVQGFVAQARRTRDFWAGSFILSWLSSVAMQEVKNQCENAEKAKEEVFLFPVEDETFLSWVRGEGEGDNPPLHGRAPNRFKASVSEEFDAFRVVSAVRRAWYELAEIIWRKDLSEHAMSYPDTRKIWQQQVNNFWEINWAITSDAQEGNVLDRRKNCRNHIQPEQAGVKCMMMDGWRELSGADRPHRDGKKNLDEFWGQLRDSSLIRIKTDLRDGEHLCAMAYIKRRFVSYFHELKVVMQGGWTLCGWRVPASIPSVSHMAAAPWLATLIQEVASRGEEKKLEEFYRLAKKITGGHDEINNSIKCIKGASDKTGIPKEWVSVDGSVFFDHALDNYKIWDADRADLKKLKKQLITLRKSVEIEPVSPFYALLMMDGDSLGSQMSKPEKHKPVSEALKKFTDKVACIVSDKNGFLIFAGGDDVVALLPLEYAFSCALSLRQFYMACFSNAGVSSTLSGAIEFVHVKMPLTRVLKDAHDLLDNVAKDSSGRDSIAVRVWKPGGLQQQWTMPWKYAIEKQHDMEEMVIVDRLANEFRSDDGVLFSSAFLYKIIKYFKLLNLDEPEPEPASDDSTDQEIKENEPEFQQAELQQVEFQQARDLLACEYLTSGITQRHSEKMDINVANECIKYLVDQCRVIVRTFDPDRSAESFTVKDYLNSDAAVLIRFLAIKGVE